MDHTEPAGAPAAAPSLGIVVSRRTAADDLPELVTIEEAAAYLGIGRTSCYALVKAGVLRSVVLGRTRRVPRVALCALRDGEQTEADRAPRFAHRGTATPTRKHQ